MKNDNYIVWFRQDLRLSDNPALFHAAEKGNIVPLFILDTNDAIGAASKWWLNKSLESLSQSLLKQGVHLILRCGNPVDVLDEICSKHNISGIYWNRLYDEYSIKRDAKIKSRFSAQLDCQSFNASLLFEPWEIKNKSGEHYKVFTSYWNSLKASITNFTILPTPKIQESPIEIVSDDLSSWNLHPHKPDWSVGFSEWSVGESDAQKRLQDFLDCRLSQYSIGRDVPSSNSTSKLSPHLHFGEISPRQIWSASMQVSQLTNSDNAWKFLSEIAWREFAYYSLYHFPYIEHKPLRPQFEKMEWRYDDKTFDTWKKGLTGYPIVDAGMRELWHTGWMHNRVRMIVGSFLVKDLLISWQDGAKWFFDTLLDADKASNSASWQWVAGCGIDSSPYFRIFNPTLQSQKFDPEGSYIKKWIPELKNLPSLYIHEPHKAPKHILQNCGIVMGITYPKPIVDHALARNRALAALKKISG
ncbi:MAG: cryptochrome/photolyase family protein [Alphaproteobacteria bacterium]|jgi:deoxyribodipyrimidine photo-lyase